MIQNWNYIRFGDLFDYENKSKIKAGDGLASGSYPFYTSSVELTKFIDQFQFDKTSLIFGTGGNASIHYCDNPFSVSTDCLVAIAKDETKVYPKYVFYYLFGNINLLEEGFKGAGLKHISKGYINEIQIPLPPLATQKRIAEILDAADALRRKDHELLKKYDELAQAIFIDMFGNPVKNERGWDMKSLEDLIISKPDNGFFAKSDKYTEAGTEIVWINDFIDQTYVKQSGLRRVQIKPTDIKYKIKYGDVLFCRSSLTLEGIGKCSIVPKLANEMTIFECHIIRLKVDINRLIPEYFRYLSDTDYFRGKIMKNAKTSTMTTISQDGISKIEIPIPNFKLQNKFRTLIEFHFDKRKKFEESYLASEALFSSLIQKAFNGELVA